MFLHAGPLHLAFNLLALFIFGAPVEERLGSRSFVGFYFLCGLGGAALSFLLMMLVPMARPIVGASGAIYGLMLAFAWYWPDAPIFVFPFPMPIPAKWLVTFAVAISLLLALPPFNGNDGVAHLAHLGGAAAALLYLKSQDWRVARAERHLRRVSEPNVLVTPLPRAARGSAPAGAGGTKPRPGADARAHAEIDRVLDKISATGIESLTPAERKFLTEMSRRMRDKR